MRNKLMASILLLIISFAFVSCGGGGGGGGGGGSGCENGITGYYLVTSNACAYGTLNEDYFYIYQEGTNISAYASRYGTFTGSIDSSCNLSLSISVTSYGNTYTYGCSGAWSSGALALNCDNVNTSTGDVTGQCAYNSEKVVGSGCASGVVQEIYYATSTSADCAAWPTYITQSGATINFGSTSGYIDSECVITMPDGSFGAYFDGFIGMITSDGCWYGIQPVVGSGCSAGISNYYNITSTYQSDYPEKPCISTGVSLVQGDSNWPGRGPLVTITGDYVEGYSSYDMDMEGFVDSKCAIELPNEGCAAAYVDGNIEMACPSCNLSFTPITTTRYQFGTYNLYDISDLDYLGIDCDAYSLGATIRVFFTDAYVDLNGQLVGTADTSKFEIEDAGGNLLLSTDYNDDYTMQFPYIDQTATGALKSVGYEPGFEMTLAPNGCEISYNE